MATITRRRGKRGVTYQARVRRLGGYHSRSFIDYCCAKWHSTASCPAMRGSRPVDITDVLGHKTLQMVRHYMHLSEVHTASVLERMPREEWG